MREIIESKAAQRYLSMVSIWEMAIKHQLGKLDIIDNFRQMIAEQIQWNEYLLLQVRQEHIYRMHTLPLHHRDPFDRLLIAQVMEENMTVLSADSAFPQYSIQNIS